MNTLYAFFIDLSHLFKRCGHRDKLHVGAALKELIACTQMQTDKKKKNPTGSHLKSFVLT